MGVLFENDDFGCVRELILTFTSSQINHLHV